VNFIRRLTFDLWYLRQPPWNSGVVAPEVEEFIASHPAGRALDLGCGTGTSSLALAGAGWQVTGVDFSPRAIRFAKKKLKERSNFNVAFHVLDVTRLPEFLFIIPYHLVLDIGCFHGLSPAGKRAYLSQMNRLLAPAGTWMMYGFFKSGEGSGPGLLPGDLEGVKLALVEKKDGVDKKNRPSAWFWFQKT
jgi:SAM-dependent methyltransferase